MFTDTEILALHPQTIRLPSNDGHLIFVRLWRPHQTEIKGAIKIAHGMAEHSGRYSDLALYLVQAGYAVIAHDHRGHGQSASQGLVGHYGDQNGWELVINDMTAVAAFARTEFPRTPLFELGHSMGSFILQQYLIREQPRIAGVILSGSSYAHPLKYLAARSIARFECKRQGKYDRSRLIRHLSFGSFNNRFKPARTQFDWLSSEPEQVDAYLNDPLCGFDCTNQLWVDLLGGLTDISRPEALRRLPNVPIFILGGALDPVGQEGEGLKRLAKMLTSTGHDQVELKLYPEGRHEMFNEKNRMEVFRDLCHWLQQQQASTKEFSSVHSA